MQAFTKNLDFYHLNLHSTDKLAEDYSVTSDCFELSMEKPQKTGNEHAGKKVGRVHAILC